MSFRSRARGFFLLCPPFVAAIAYVDPGNVAANISGGARYGYRLVWVLVVANRMAGLVQYRSAKVGLVSGRTLPVLLGDRLMPTTPRRALVTAREGGGVGMFQPAVRTVFGEEGTFVGLEGGHHLCGQGEWSADLDTSGAVGEAPVSEGSGGAGPFVLVEFRITRRGRGGDAVTFGLQAADTGGLRGGE